MRIKLKLWDKNGKRVYSSTSTKRALIRARLRTLLFLNGYLRVNYGNGFFNDTEQKVEKETLFWALRTFTEASLVRSIQPLE